MPPLIFQPSAKKFNINAQYPKQYKFSPIIEDITLVLPPETMVGKIIDQIKNTKLVASVSVSTVWQNSLTVRVEFNSDAKQLTQSEANQVKEEIIADLSGKFSVTFKTNTTVIPAQAGIYNLKALSSASKLPSKSEWGIGSNPD